VWWQGAQRWFRRYFAVPEVEGALRSAVLPRDALDTWIRAEGCEVAQ